MSNKVEIDTDMWTGLFLWAFIPNMVTDFILNRYLGWRYERGSPHRPKPGEPKYKKWRGRIYLVVVLGYLAYSFMRTFSTVATKPNLYKTMSVSPGPLFSSKDLRSSWRKISVQYHPDKNQDDPSAEEKYIMYRQAYEILNDPGKRYAYDHFGTVRAIEDCKNCKEDRDYVWQVGWPSFWQGHLANSMIMFVIFYLLPGTGSGDAKTDANVRNLRLLLHIGSILAEAYLLFGAGATGLFAKVLNHFGMTTHDMVTLLRQLVMTLFVAISHIFTVIGAADVVSTKDMKTRLEELATLTQAELVEVTHSFTRSFDAFKDNPNMIETLKRKMEKLARDLRAFETPEVRDAFGKARARKFGAASGTVMPNGSGGISSMHMSQQDGVKKRK